MIIISAQNKYFQEGGLAFWDKLRCFSGLWEQVETGKYLPIVVSADGENLGTDGDQEEIERIKSTKSYGIAGFPCAAYIGCVETENSVWLYWKAEDGTYYSDIAGVMEVERCVRESQERDRENERQKRIKK